MIGLRRNETRLGYLVESYRMKGNIVSLMDVFVWNSEFPYFIYRIKTVRNIKDRKFYQYQEVIERKIYLSRSAVPRTYRVSGVRVLRN